MIVICKKETKRIVKGARYEVDTIRLRGGRFFISIKGIGSYIIDNFTTTDGNPVPKVAFAPIRQPIEYLKVKFEDLKIGDILVCITDRYKNLIKGRMYKISDAKSINKDRISYSGTILKHSDNSIKFEGSNRFLKFNSWSFRSLDREEARGISLNSILSEEVSFAVDSSIRKIDLVDNKDVELIKVLSKAIVDQSRHHLDVIGWACEKSAGYLGIERSDYDKFLNMPLKQILEIFKQS